MEKRYCEHNINLNEGECPICTPLMIHQLLSKYCFCPSCIKNSQPPESEGE